MEIDFILAIQWVWPAFLFPILLFAPESPWHLVRKGRLEEAERSLKRLMRASSGIDTKETLAIIVHTNNLEEELSTGTSYIDCFKGPELRRTEIACVAFAGQVLSGSTFAYNSTYFFQQVGLSTSTTYKLNTGGTAMALFGTLIAWFALMPYLGRRTIYLWGMFTMSMILFIIGILNVKTENKQFSHSSGRSPSSFRPDSSAGLSRLRWAPLVSVKRPSVWHETHTTSSL
jgi:SP family general alpha glucoside:H+ symporter-like MFS transporter